jgi:transposase
MLNTFASGCGSMAFVRSFRPKSTTVSDAQVVQLPTTRRLIANVIERRVPFGRGWLKERRSLATRFEKLAVNYMTMLQLAFIQRYLRLLAPAT